ncbi:MAG: DNA-directed RNA polymerase subunit beta', partial [Pseudonocardiaceae bacterium]
RGTIGLQAKIRVRLRNVVPPVGEQTRLRETQGWEPGSAWIADTTVGRVVFNDLLPEDYPYVNDVLPKKRQAAIVNDLAERYPMVAVAQTLDKLKDAGFHWATRSGVTLASADVVVPTAKQEILDKYEAKADQVEKRYQRGVLSHDERNAELVKIWSQATDEVAKAMEANFAEDNPVFTIVSSGAAGNMTQVRSLAGMRGLVSNPKGEYIPRPIKANFREGLSVLEYFIATHGARKGLADTALRTADSGYLTRRLVDVSQDVIVREHDCSTERGIQMPVSEVGPDAMSARHRYVGTGLISRRTAEDVLNSSGSMILPRGADLGDSAVETLMSAGVERVKVRSVLTCEAASGVCAMCYGRSMATGKLVDVGEAVGIVAAQSIGEPGTQLTMRTFHSGGVAGDDITTGLPRVQELFEARVPKGMAPIADADGTVRVEDGEKFWRITIIPDDGSEEIVYDKLSKRQRLAVISVDGTERSVQDGDHVAVGQKLLEGVVDPHEVLRVMGPREVQLHLVREVQQVYRSQGVDIHDKHIEVIVRQMLRRVTIIDSGSTEFLPGALAERSEFESENRRVVAEGGEPAAGRPVLM